MSVCRYLDVLYIFFVCVRVNDDACVYVCACACVLCKSVLFVFVCVRRPHCKLDFYTCTILLMIYVLFV